MSHQFKAGDLALVIGSSRADSPNIGKAVELKEFVRSGHFFQIASGAYIGNGGLDAWLCEDDGIMALNGLDEWVNGGGQALLAQRHLLPLRGDFAPEQAKSREVAA